MKKAKQTHHKRRPTPKNRSLVSVIFVGFGVIVAGVTLLLLSRGQQSTYEPMIKGSPRLEVDQEEVNYGNVRFETPVESVFRVTNVGDQPLKLLGEPVIELLEGC